MESDSEDETYSTSNDEETRSKNKVITIEVDEKLILEEWTFDGSSTGQSLSATTSDVIIRPVRLYKNPLIISSFESVLVLCECLNKDLSLTKK